MSWFFRRILFSLWSILILSSIITILIFNASSKPQDNSEKYVDQLVNLVAQDLRETLKVDPTNAATSVATQHILNFERLLQIYIVNPQGQDILSRDLPIRVRLLIGQAGGTVERSLSVANDLYVHTEGLNGYWVIGHQSGFRLSRILFLPGGRAVLFVTALALSVLFSLILARFIVIPIRKLREAGQAVANGDLSVRVAGTVGHRKDDIASLARDFDVMTERIDGLLKNQERLMQDVSHELRSPLNRIQALVSLVEQKHGTDKFVSKLNSEIDTLNELIGRILLFSRLSGSQTLTMEPFDLMELLHSLAEDAELEGNDRAITVEVIGPQNLTIVGNSDALHSAFENIIRNALRFSPDHSSIEVRVFDDRSNTEVIISDKGPGVPKEEIETIFKSFHQVTQAPGRTNSGLGLSIASRAVQLHGGTIFAENIEPSGLRVITKFGQKTLEV